jgi:hypothetical protein
MILEFTESELIALNNALMLAPYGKVAGLVNSINKQINTQKESNSANEEVN